MKFTVLGGSGFIGSRLVKHLETCGHIVQVASRDATEISSGTAGHVVCCIGLTSDFRTRPYEAVDAHVCTPARLMRTMQFDSWLTLSSTRLYGGLRSSELATEDHALPMRPGRDGLYDGSKLVGEALTFAHPAPTARVVRLSTVCGAGQERTTFLASILEDVFRDNAVVVREDPASAKDYIDIDDVLRLIEAIALRGKSRIYNVASGTNISHASLADQLRQKLGARVEFAADAPKRTFARVDIARISQEFGFTPSPFHVVLDRMIAAVRPHEQTRTQKNDPGQS